MSFEEWWNSKDYSASCKGNCKEAYEAGYYAKTEQFLKENE